MRVVWRRVFDSALEAAAAMGEEIGASIESDFGPAGWALQELGGERRWNILRR
jgi:hypothetical protein